MPAVPLRLPVVPFRYDTAVPSVAPPSLGWHCCPLRYGTQSVPSRARSPPPTVTAARRHTTGGRRWRRTLLCCEPPPPHNTPQPPPPSTATDTLPSPPHRLLSGQRQSRVLSPAPVAASIIYYLFHGFITNLFYVDHSVHQYRSTHVSFSASLYTKLSAMSFCSTLPGAGIVFICKVRHYSV